MQNVNALHKQNGVTVDYLCGAPTTALTEEALKEALFGKGTIVTDEMWNEVKSYAEFIKVKHSKQ